jgi:hypothetical protein
MLDRGVEDRSRLVAAITGASSGLGAIFARKLAERGFDLLLVARRRERLEDLSGSLQMVHGAQVEVLPADLTKDGDLERVAQRIEGEPRLGLLVNNAGFGTRGHFYRASREDQLDMFRLHVLATVRLTHAALPGMVERNRGWIVNVSSVAGFVQTPGYASYNSSKAWITSFTEGLHLELRSAGSAVRVQALCPGYTHTEFHDRLGVDRSKIMPRGGFWMTADYVVDESLRGLDDGKWRVIPNWRYRALVRTVSLLPRPLLHRIVLRLQRDHRISPTDEPAQA